MQKKRSNWTIFKFFLTGVIGTIVFYLLYLLFYNTLLGYKFFTEYYFYYSTVAWITSYMISILIQHFLHRKLVFNDAKNSSYFKSLLLTYIAYILSMILSAILNDILIYNFEFNFQLSCIITIIITGLGNYFIIEKFITLTSKNSKKNNNKSQIITEP
jgi:putative flippase GtrA